MSPRGTTVDGQFERIMQPIYSSASLANNGTSANLFTTTVGASTGGVWGSTIPTLADTNMTIAGMLPAGYSHETKAIALQFATTISRADIQAIMKGGFFTLKIASKDQLQIPLECLGGGSGIDGFSTTTAAAGNEIFHNGIADPRAVYPMDPSIFIGSTQNITCQVQWSAAVTLAATQPFRVVFHGWLTRPVQ